MSEEAETVEEETVAADQGDESTDTEAAQEESEELGDKGKKALSAMKEREKAARAEARDLKRKLADLESAAAAKDKGPDEQAVDAARREAAAEATAKANERILKSEVKAAAAGKLSDPKDALRLLDLDQFEIGDDGEVDSEELSEAISDLLEKKPYLAAQRGTTQFDSGRGKRAPGGQLTKSDVERMSPDEITTARKAGRLDNLLGKNR